MKSRIAILSLALAFAVATSATLPAVAADYTASTEFTEITDYGSEAVNVSGGSDSDPIVFTASANENGFKTTGALSTCYSKLRIESGTYSAGAHTIAYRGDNYTGGGVLTMAGGHLCVGKVTLSVYGRSGTLNLNAGIFETKEFSATTAAANLNFNGGTLKAASSVNSTFILASPMSITIGSDGGTLDTNGKVITINAASKGEGILSVTGEGVAIFAGKAPSLNIVANTAVMFATADALPDSALAVGAGGVVLGNMFNVDLSNKITWQNTYPLNISNTVATTWANTVPATQGDFVKWGAGTLTLPSVPLNSGSFTIQQGAVCLPQGSV